MDKLRFRQIHQDFHTSPTIKGIGEAFDREEFKQALKTGHVDSVTVFSKCHHGYSYHPATAGEMHPGLKFDLLGAQLRACEEAGVRAPVYISAGLDERYAVKHPECLVKFTPDQPHDFLNTAGYHLLCFNTPYMDELLAQTREVVEKYRPEEIFFDICDIRPCYCNCCLASMREKGYDPHNGADVYEHGREVYYRAAERMREAVQSISPDTDVFFNAGRVPMNDRRFSSYDTHLELESLPTGGWGYDHFPMSALYSRTLGKEYLGMTGKFHTTWGEFGGFKHPKIGRAHV